MIAAIRGLRSAPAAARHCFDQSVRQYGEYAIRPRRPVGYCFRVVHVWSIAYRPRFGGADHHFLRQFDDGQADGQGPDVDHRIAARRPKVRVAMPPPGTLAHIHLDAPKGFAVRGDHDTVAFGLKRQEQLTCKLKRFVETTPGYDEVDQ